MTAPKGWLVAAPRSGGGKTTVTLGLVAALRRRGVPVRTAKSGPDYIDPAFHAAASGLPGTNLDSWAMPPDLLDHLMAGGPGAPPLLVAESAMGLFDGVAAPQGRSGAAADLAERFGLPVLLVLDVSGQSQTAAAVALGLDRFRPGVRVGGVILNRVGSERHRAGVTAALAAIGLPVLGAIPRDPALALPERHLGLVQASEHPDLEARLAGLADMAERCLDLDAIMAGAGLLGIPASRAIALPPPGQRIALARDAAFSFVYPHVLAGWREAGAEIVPFSPLADEPPPPGCDACWLPGGYPELHAGRLAAAASFRAGLLAFDGPVHGECGGYMALGAGLVDAAGVRHAMAGLLGHATSFAVRRMTLGYRAAATLAASALGPAGTRLRGHEFHYAQVTESGTDAPLATMQDGQGNATGPAGGARGRVSGGFFHAIALDEAPI
ncbi:MAG: cobyrinate a,c-diamide synthase [Janthinobacterium lividum]